MRNWLIFISIGFLYTGCVDSRISGRESYLATPQAPAVQQATPTKEDEKIERLRQIVPARPTIVGFDQVAVMREAAETKRNDALRLLVRCLAYNFDPGNSNERRSQSEMIPAIGMIERNFKQKSGNILYEVATSEAREWLADRIALAAREILDDSTRDDLAGRFLADRSNPRVNYFSETLSRPNLTVKLAERGR